MTGVNLPNQAISRGRTRFCSLGRHIRSEVNTFRDDCQRRPSRSERPCAWLRTADPAARGPAVGVSASPDPDGRRVI